MKHYRQIIRLSRRTLFGLRMLGLFLWSAASIFAAPGDLDPTFGSGGKVVSSPDNSQAIAGRSMARQADGKIVMAGSRMAVDSTTEFIVARYNADGSLDTTFGNGGWNSTTFGVVAETGLSMDIQPDGKIAVGGTLRYAGNPAPSYDFGIVRFNADGSLDSSFDGDGRRVIDFSDVLDAFYNENFSELKVTSDGKIIAAGTALNSGVADRFVLAKLNADGSLDNSFGSGGKFVDQTYSSNMDRIYDMLVLPDGKIVAAGTLITAFGNYRIVIKYQANGGREWVYQQGVPDITNTEALYGIAMQPDGKFVATGSRGGKIYAVRLNANGTEDASFSTAAVTPAGGAGSVAVQSDGKIVANVFVNGGSSSFSLIRYNANGSLDTTFGSGGIAATSVTAGQDSAAKVIIQPDGKILVGGSSRLSSPTRYFISIVRYQGDFIARRRSLFDFDGDGRADVSVFRPTNGTWYIARPTGDPAQNFDAARFGQAGDTLVPADYDGDGKSDVAVFRSGVWYLNRSTLGYTGVQFGQTGDVPVPADYDGDGKADIAIFRPSEGNWYLLQSTAGFGGVNFGLASDKPVPGDYNGDGRAEVAMFRPSNGTWYIARSMNNASQNYDAVSFGTNGDLAVPADYDGDGKTDVAVFRPSNGTWYLSRSTLGFVGIQFGQAGDLPTAADYDGDGKADVAVFRGGAWYLQRSTSGFAGVSFGIGEDKPTPNAFVR